MNDYKLSDMGIKCPVSFNEEEHIYTYDPTGENFTSVSKVLSHYSEPFDRDGVSKAMARGNKSVQREILKKWDKNKNDSIDWGNKIHNALEDYGNMGYHNDPVFDKLGKQVSEIIGPVYKSFQELLIWDIGSMVAGTADRPVLRTRGPKAILDVYDYKTNLKKGIEFNSSYFNSNNEYKHLKKFFYPPISHLEDCNYNKYSLQLSIYAYMISKLFGVIVGQLAIIFIEPKFEGSEELVARRIPVPYLFNEAKAMLDNFKPLKKLPQKKENPPVIKSVRENAKTEMFITDEDW